MPTSKELTTKAENGLAPLPDGYLEDFPEGYDEADHTLPVFTIVQPTSSVEKKALGKDGQFVAKDGTTYDTLRFVLISVQYGRGLPAPFEGHDKGGQMWYCRSDDRRMGLMFEPMAVLGEDGRDIEGQTYIECGNCPHFEDEKKWAENGCRYTYLLRCIDRETERPFGFFVRSSAVAPIRSVIVDGVTPRVMKGGNVMPPQHVFWWAEFEMSTIQKQGKGIYYVPQPRVSKPLDESEKTYYSQFYGTVRTATVEELDPEYGSGQASFEA